MMEVTMSLNRTLVAGASSVIVALGTQAPKVFASKSPACLQAIANKATESMINLACGKGLHNGDLFLMIVVGGGAFLVITFWKDIAQFFWERMNSESTN
jgi:hypothetical protein